MSTATSTQLFREVASTTGSLIVNDAYGFFIMVIGIGLAILLVLGIMFSILKIVKRL